MRGFRFLTAVLVLMLLASCGTSWAQAPQLDSSLNESIVMVAKKGFFTTELETTIYKPEGNGPFPLVVINHGKAPGDPRFQERYRPALAARYFLQRGYAVAVPMRQGFSKSTGSYIGGGCNIESNGKVQAEDVKTVLDYVLTLGWADKDRILVVGQSHGGWTTLAFGTLNYPGVRGLVNFAGGLRQDSCTAWESGLARAAGSFGRETRVPSLWFYGDNDSFFSPDTYRPMFQQYREAAGQAELIAFGVFGSDAHGMFGARTGAPIWQPEVTKFLAKLGLPSEQLAQQSRFAAAAPMVPPPATRFAELGDEAKVPHVRDAGRAGYKNYLTKSSPRAFAIAPSGSWGWAEGGDDPLARALENCNRSGKGACQLYSVDDRIVWKTE